jgi:hypothetical protein
MTKYPTRIISTTVIISAGIVVALVGVPASAIATGAARGAHLTGGRSAAGTQRCSTSQLRISVIGRQGALGTTYWDLGLQNLGRAACHTRGYPGVGLIDRYSRLINVLVQRVPGHPEPTITLRSGQSAYFTFGYPSLVGACVSHFSAYSVQIIPPNEYQRLVLRTNRFDVCTPSRVVANPQVFPLRSGLLLSG